MKGRNDRKFVTVFGSKDTFLKWLRVKDTKSLSRFELDNITQVYDSAQAAIKNANTVDTLTLKACKLRASLSRPATLASSKNELKSVQNLNNDPAERSSLGFDYSIFKNSMAFYNWLRLPRKANKTDKSRANQIIAEGNACFMNGSSSEDVERNAIEFKSYLIKKLTRPPKNDTSHTKSRQQEGGKRSNERKSVQNLNNDPAEGSSLGFDYSIFKNSMEFYKWLDLPRKADKTDKKRANKIIAEGNACFMSGSSSEDVERKT